MAIILPFLVLISPVTYVVYLASLAYYTYAVFLAKNKESPEYTIYSSRSPYRSLFVNLFLLEPSFRAFVVLFNTKRRKRALRGAISYKTFAITMQRVAIVFVSGVPIVYIKMCYDMLKVIDEVSPKSSKDFKLCIRKYLAPEISDDSP